MIALAVFVAGVLGTVGFGYYNEKVKPLHETIITVNEKSFDMKDYVDRLDALTEGADKSRVNSMAGPLADQIIDSELLRQGARSFGIGVSNDEIEQAIEENEVPDNQVYREMVGPQLLAQKLQDHFESQVPDTTEQSRFRSLVVETHASAEKAISQLRTSTNFTAVVEEFSVNPNIETDPGWLPEELITNSEVREAAFETEPGKAVSFYDDSAVKNVGYWIIEVLDKDEEKGVEVRTMLLGSQEKADSVSSDVTHENFGPLAQEFSQYTGAEEGGELGWVKDAKSISPKFDEVVSDLEPGTISDPVRDENVRTQGAYWVIQVVERGKHEVSDKVRERLGAKWFDEWFTELKQSSQIDNQLDADKKSEAVQMVMKRR